MDTSALFGFDASSLWSKNSRQKRKYGTGLSTGTNLPEDISTALGAAETSYIKGDYSHAIELLSEVTKKAPRLAEPYSILALIYEETGDRKHALQLYALAAAFSKRNLELWRKVLLLSIQMGEYQQASVALLRCYSLSSTAEQDFGHVRIVLTAMLGQYRELHAMIKSHMTRNPEDVALLVKVIDLMVDMGYNVRGIKYATQYLQHWYINDHDSRVNIQLTEDQADELIYNLVSITFVVRSLVMLYIDRLKLVEAQKILENTFLVFNVAFRTCSMRDESFTFPHELSLLLGYLTLRLGVAKEDEVTIDRGLQILQPIIATVVNNPNLLLDPVFPKSTDSSTLNSESTIQINMQELETTVSTLHFLLLVAKKMSDLNMKMRSMKIMDFILDVFRSLLNKAPHAVKSSVVCQVAKYFQVLQRHEEVVELAESAIAGNLFSSETIHLYAVEVMDHTPEKLSQVEVTTSLYLRVLLDEGVRIRKLMMGSRGSKMFGGDEEDDEEEEAEEGEDEEEEVENDGNSDEEKTADEKLIAKKKVSKEKKSKTKPGRKGKTTNDEEDTGDHVLSLSSLNNHDSSQEPLVASLPIVQEMDVDEEENEEDEMDQDYMEDGAVPIETVSEEDFTQDMDMFMEECETNNALNNAPVPREEHVKASVAETSTSSLSMGALPFNSFSSSSSSSSKMLLSDSFLGIADPIFQKSFPLVNLTRQNSAASVEASTAANNADHADNAEEVSSSSMSGSTHPVTAVAAEVTEEQAQGGLFSFLVSNVTASLFPKDSMPLKLLSNYHAKHANDQSASQAESHKVSSQHMWEFFTPLHARHSFHRRILHDVLQVICTHAIVLAKQVENNQSSSSSLSSSVKGDLDLLPVLTMALLQAYSRVLSRRLKTRETVRMKLFMTQWQTQETSVAQAASTLLWKELHHKLHAKTTNTFDASSINETVDVRLQEKITLAALIHTLCDYIPLETIVDKDYFDVLLPEVMSQYNALTVSATLTQETLSRQRDLFVQQAMALPRIDEILQHRRRHRSGWLSVHGPAMMTTGVSLDNQHHGTEQHESLSQQPGAPRVQQRRTLFNHETWLQTASMISPEVRQAAARLWEQPDDVNTANQMFRLLVEEAYHVSPSAPSHNTTIQGMALEKTFVSSEIYLENRLPIRTLVLEIPEANARSGLAHFLAGHEVALVRKHLEAVDSYLNAFLLSPEEPLISLTLAGYFLFLSTHPLFRARYDNMLRALCFLINYQKLRRRCPLPPSSVDSLFATNGKKNGNHANIAPKYLQFFKEVTTYQETLYNLGRTFHDMKLHHLAVANYRKVLQLYDEHLSSHAIATAINQEVAAIHSKITGVTREAAHNLVLLYRHSQAKDLALSIMLKYLRF